MFAATVVTGIALAIAFFAAGSTKIAAIPPMRASAEHFGLPFLAYRAIGALEVAAAAGLLIGLAVPLLGVAAGVGLVLLMIGALGFHLRAGDAPALWAITPILATLALAHVLVRLASW